MEDLKLAILIDADNISPKYVKVILDEAATFGVAACKRIYGDWSDVRLKSWKDALLNNSIIPIQQYSYTTVSYTHLADFEKEQLPMRAVIQRVTRASVTVNGGEPRAIGPGLVILLGVRDTDDSAIVPKLAEKCAHLRIFEDEDGKLNRSAVELGYSALVVSNFTLYGDTSRGKRPSFIHAARGELAVPCYEKFLEEMSHQGLKDLQHGEFGADMKIDLVNDGPVTIVIDTDEWKK